MSGMDLDKVPLQFKYFHFIATLFVLTFIISNLLATKIAHIGYFNFPAGMIIFPLSYVFGNILTEVYGFQRTRQLLWFTIFCELIVYLTTTLAVALPPAQFWHGQIEYQNLLLPQINIIIASRVGYFFGDFVNSKVLSKLKLKYGNSFIAARFIGSTALGVLVDNAIFTLLAYSYLFLSHKISFSFMCWFIVSRYIMKVSYEIIMSPFSVLFSNWLKNKEKVDIYDINTNFSIFKIKIDEMTHQNKYAVS